MYNHDTVIDSYQLIVNDLSKMTAYYETQIGLTVLTTSFKTVTLGVGNYPLLTLIAGQPQTRTPQSGLYHTAFLVSDATTLGGVLLHLLQTQTPLVGGTNHGYSEALYLQDPEGNGIEIYHDQPLEQWDRREDGRIVGITAELDGDHLLKNARALDKLPVTTKIGHIHLQVNSLADTYAFYHDLLGFELKDFFQQSALFMADGLYHHHIAANIWAGTSLPQRKDGSLGLQSFTVRKADLATVATRLHQDNHPYTFTDHRLLTTDPNGIRVVVKQLK